MPYDVLVVGAGLAGSCAALALSARFRVLLLDATGPAAGASGAAAGLAHRFPGPHAHALADGATLLTTLLETADAADYPLRPTGVLRPALDAPQAERFQQRALLHPGVLTWHAADTLAERFPHLHAPHGGLWISDGCVVDVPAFVEAVLAAAQARGAETRWPLAVTNAGADARCAWVETPEGRVEAARVVLAPGAGFRTLPVLDSLGLHAVKGQVARLRAPALTGRIPAISTSAYVVPAPDGFVVGSSFEHSFRTEAPTDDVQAALHAQAAALVPALADAERLPGQAGVRVTRVGSRAPMLGPIPGHERLWVMGALGAKGLLQAPALARSLAASQFNADRIPADWRPVVR